MSEIFIIPDGDSGGKKFVERIEKRLIHRTKLNIVDIPRGFDPDELGDDELFDLLVSARNPRRNVHVKINYKRK